jgi:hypothetical protein
MVNVQYIDLCSGLLKVCDHATFGEAWYCSPIRPLAAQLLYGLGLKEETETTDTEEPGDSGCDTQPPSQSLSQELLHVPPGAQMNVLPLRLGTEPQMVTRSVSKMIKEEIWVKVQDLCKGTAMDGSKEQQVIAKAVITHNDIVPVYFPSDPYNAAFKEQLDM